MITSYDEGTLSTIPFAAPGSLGDPPSVSYSGRKFTFYSLNKGGTRIIIQFSNIIGIPGKTIVSDPGDPGIALDNIPWDAIGGGITALSATVPGLLLWALYSTDGIIPDQNVGESQLETTYSTTEELVPLTIVESAV